MRPGKLLLQSSGSEMGRREGLPLEGLFPVLEDSSPEIQEWAKGNGLWARAGLKQENLVSVAFKKTCIIN